MELIFEQLSKKYPSFYKRTLFNGKFDFNKFVLELCLNPIDYFNFKYSGSEDVSYEMFIPNSPKNIFLVNYDFLIEAIRFEQSKIEDEEDLKYIKYDKLIKKTKSSFVAEIYKEELKDSINYLTKIYFKHIRKSGKSNFSKDSLFVFGSYLDEAYQIAFKMFSHNANILKASPIPIVNIENSLVRGALYSCDEELYTFLGQDKGDFPSYFLYKTHLIKKPLEENDIFNLHEEFKQFRDFSSKKYLIESENDFEIEKNEKPFFKEVTYYSDNLGEFKTYINIPSFTHNLTIGSLLRISNEVVFDFNKKFKTFYEKSYKNKNLNELYQEFLKKFFIDSLEEELSIEEIENIYDKDKIVSVYQLQNKNEIKRRIYNFLKDYDPEELYRKRLFVKRIIANRMAENATNIDLNYRKNTSVLNGFIPSFSSFDSFLFKVVEKIEQSENKEEDIIEGFIKFSKRKENQEVMNRIFSYIYISDKLYKDSGINKKVKELMGFAMLDIEGLLKKYVSSLYMILPYEDYFLQKDIGENIDTLWLLFRKDKKTYIDNIDLKERFISKLDLYEIFKKDNK